MLNYLLKNFGLSALAAVILCSMVLIDQRLEGIEKAIKEATAAQVEVSRYAAAVPWVATHYKPIKE